MLLQVASRKCTATASGREYHIITKSQNRNQPKTLRDTDYDYDYGSQDLGSKIQDLGCRIDAGLQHDKFEFRSRVLDYYSVDAQCLWSPTKARITIMARPETTPRWWLDNPAPYIETSRDEQKQQGPPAPPAPFSLCFLRSALCFLPASCLPLPLPPFSASFQCLMSLPHAA